MMLLGRRRAVEDKTYHGHADHVARLVSNAFDSDVGLCDTEDLEVV